MDFLLFAILIMIAHITINFIQKLIDKKIHCVFIYCPRCNDRVTKNGKYMRTNDGIIKYRCPKCGNVSFWVFIHYPVLFLRTCGDCKYLIGDKFGALYCEKQQCKECNPETQRMFEYK